MDSRAAVYSSAASPGEKRRIKTGGAHSAGLGAVSVGSGKLMGTEPAESN
jgi:hypothetical protein